MLDIGKMYYFIDKAAFSTAEYTNFKYIELPCEIQSISWIYRIMNQNLLQLGINVPNLSVNLGVTNQPYLSSYVTTIGELGIYKAQIDSMADMLNQMNLYTIKFHFNQLTHRLNVLTNVEHHLILEAYINIPIENLMVDHYFLKYVTAWAKLQQGRMLGQYTFTLPGGVTYNSADMVSQGQTEMKEVEDEIKGMSTSSFFIMVKR